MESGEFLPQKQVETMIKEKEVTPWLREGYDILRDKIRFR